MKGISRGRRVGMSAAVLIAAAAAPAIADEPPAWAYPINPPGHPAPVDDGKVRTLSGSTAQFTFPQLRDLFTPPDS